MKGEKCVNVCDSLLLIVKFQQMCVCLFMAKRDSFRIRCLCASLLEWKCCDFAKMSCLTDSSVVNTQRSYKRRRATS